MNGNNDHRSLNGALGRSSPTPFARVIDYEYDYIPPEEMTSDHRTFLNSSVHSMIIDNSLLREAAQQSAPLLYAGQKPYRPASDTRLQTSQACRHNHSVPYAVQTEYPVSLRPTKLGGVKTRPPPQHLSQAEGYYPCSPLDEPSSKQKQAQQRTQPPEKGQYLPQSPQAMAQEPSRDDNGVVWIEQCVFPPASGIFQQILPDPEAVVSPERDSHAFPLEMPGNLGGYSTNISRDPWMLQPGHDVMPGQQVSAGYESTFGHKPYPVGLNPAGPETGISDHSQQTTHTCIQCGDAFERADELGRHFRVHTRPHQCQQCGRSFRFRKDLRRHCSTAHSASRPYKCRFKYCKYAQHGFKRADYLSRHLETMHPGATAEQLARGV